MITKSNNPLTEDEIAKYNAAIADFVKKNSNYVNYSELDDGNTYITLQYGMVRNSALREIANRCRASLTDEVFKIGTLNCTIQFATSGILRFVGKTAEIHAELPNLDKETYGELIKKTSSEINLPTSLTADVGSLASTIATFATLSDSKLAEMGITTSTIGNKKHISFDVSKIEKYATKNPSNEQAVALNVAISSVIGAYKEYPKATLTKITESLSSAGLELERLNGNVIMLSLGIAKSDDENNSGDPSGTTDEFVYEKTPGSINYVILHYGNAQSTSASIDNFEVIVVDGNGNVPQVTNYESGAHHIDLPIFILKNKKDGTVIAADYIEKWIRPDNETDDDEWFYRWDDNKFVGDDGREYEDTSYNRIIHNPNAAEKQAAYDAAKQKYLNYAIGFMSKITTSDKLIAKWEETYENNFGSSGTLGSNVNDILRNYITRHSEDIDVQKFIGYIKSRITIDCSDYISDFEDLSNSDLISQYFNFDESSAYRGGASEAKSNLLIGNSDGTTHTEIRNDDYRISRTNNDICADATYMSFVPSIYENETTLVENITTEMRNVSGSKLYDYQSEDMPNALRIQSSHLQYGESIIAEALNRGRAIDIYFIK